MTKLLLAAVLLSGCAAPKSVCREASVLATREPIEICESRICRSLATGKFVDCPR